ncbi:MFS transporter [Kitasatospora purpeofusca]|uniref:MFS transporter n=1 Tax=Kitasatospora purpeofusca TaxID=67352 RepID=UPI00224CDAB7|nr:MFS transporter [Kitasatospora purpeofusca]MCX4690034.1 MFS transporter [Kitasatospora purpeofusca]
MSDSPVDGVAVHTPVPAAAGQVARAPYRWRWVALWVLLAAEAMDMLDALVANVAAPSIRADLGGGAATVQWLGAAYALAMAVGLITGGRLGDIVGRERMFLIGALGFTAASLLCAVSWSSGMLIRARGLQGLFGAVMIPQGLGIIKEMFEGPEIGRAFGLFGPVMAAATVGGPVLAGVLVDADLFGSGWRMIFLINLPLGLLALLGGWKFLPESRSARRPRLDLTGAALASSAALLLLVLPLVQGRELGWPTWTFVSMAAGIGLFSVFGRYEMRVARAGGDPLVVPGLFRKRAFSAGLVTGAVFFAAVAGFSLVLSLFLQSGLGLTPLRAGLASLPWSLGMVLGFAAVRAVERFGDLERLGRRVIRTGLVVMALGIAVLGVTLNTAGTGVTLWHLAPALVLAGLGTGLVMGPFFDTVLGAVEPHESGSASGTVTAVQQLGSAMGVAVLGTVFFGGLGGPIAGSADLAARTAAVAGYSATMQVTLWAGTGLLAAALAASFLLPRPVRAREH